MIRMPLQWLVFTALFIFLTGILFTWICYEIGRRRREASQFRSWTRCPICAFQYKANREARIQKCPQCGSKNENIPISPI